VFALAGNRILRLFREPAGVPALIRQREFLAAIDGRLQMPTPAIADIDAGGRFTIERRLPGRSLLRLLPALAGERRKTAIRAYVAAAATVGAVTFPDRPYGQILAENPIHAGTWTGFLRASLDRAIAENGAEIEAVGDVPTLRAIALDLLAAVPERPSRALVHGDYFPGNVLMHETLAVTGLVDFSAYTMIGDPQYDVLTAPIFLEMIVETGAEVVALAEAAARDLAGGAASAARFYRAHAAFWMANAEYALPPYPTLYPWAVANLKRLAAGGPY
jgi:aminoglycoside phosphotransferase (APT) family kinase protein